MITNLEEISLFKDGRPENPITKILTLSGPSILESEIKHAKNWMKNNKAPGPNNMYLETFHLISERNLEVIVRLFNNIYDIGLFSKDWVRSTFIALPKSNSSSLCKDYCLISLMSHFLKLLLPDPHIRLYKKCEDVSAVVNLGLEADSEPVSVSKH